jgi:hypothetical protein
MSLTAFDAWLDKGSRAWLEGNAKPLSVVLKSVDPHAYELLYLDWMNPENDTSDSYEDED